MESKSGRTSFSSVCRKSCVISSWAHNVILAISLFALTGLTASCGLPASGTSATPRISASKIVQSSTVLPQGTLGAPYSAILVSGVRGSFSFNVSAGTLPPGLNLDYTSGSIRGIPTGTGSFHFSLNIRDVARTEDAESRQFSVTIVPKVSDASVALSVSPGKVSVVSGTVQQFIATSANPGNRSVVWSVSAGAISSGGVFTAPKVTSNTSVSVTATSVSDFRQQATADVLVLPQSNSVPVSISVTPSSATIASSATQQFTASV